MEVLCSKNTSKRVKKEQKTEKSYFFMPKTSKKLPIHIGVLFFVCSVLSKVIYFTTNL